MRKKINLNDAIDALKQERVEDALRLWRDYQEGEGVCDTYLCENAGHYWSCCANHFQGWLLTLSLSGQGEDYLKLSKKIGKWIDSQNIQKENEGTERLRLPDSLLIGHPSIDRDHKNLIKIINDISVSLENNNYEMCSRLLNDFLELLKKHFHKEEKILEKVGFSELVDHKQAHSKLMKKSKILGEMIPDFSNSELAKERFYTELVSLLFDDAIKADFTFKAFLENREVYI